MNSKTEKKYIDLLTKKGLSEEEINKLIKQQKYLETRIEQIEINQINKGANYYKQAQKQFNKAFKNIEREIEVWYMRIADNNGISLQEARKLLKAKELEEFKWTVEEYIEKGKTLNYTDEFMKELENSSARAHISRLEALKIQLHEAVENLYENQQTCIESILGDVYKYGFYHTCYEIQKGIGVGVNIHRINETKLKMLLNKPWAADGTNFSQKIWGKYRPQLIKWLETELTQSIMRGDDPKKLISKIAKKFNSTYKQAGRLIMSETAYFSSLSKWDAYKEMDVEKYEIVATLDSHTSELCRDLDGEVFDMKDYKPGLTAPPFHVGCRTSTCSFIMDEFEVDIKRIARNPVTGEQYYINGNTTYIEWEEMCVQ